MYFVSAWNVVDYLPKKVPAKQRQTTALLFDVQSGLQNKFFAKNHHKFTYVNNIELKRIYSLNWGGSVEAR